MTPFKGNSNSTFPVENDRKEKLFLSVTIIIAVLVRLWTILDKGVSINEISYWLPAVESHTLTELFNDTISITHNHQFGYLLIPWLVHRLGGTVNIVRLVSLVFGLLSIPVTFLFVRRFFGRKVAIIVSMLLAISPFHAFYSVDLSPYMLFYLLTTLILYNLFMALETGRTGYFVFTVLLNFLNISMHFSALALVIVEALTGYSFILLRREGLERKVLFVKMTNTILATAIVFLPWLPSFRRTTTFVESSLIADRAAHFDSGYAVQAPLELFRLIGGIPMEVVFAGVLPGVVFLLGIYRALLKTRRSGPVLFALTAVFSPIIELSKVVPIILSTGGYLLILRLFLYLFPIVWSMDLWFLWSIGASLTSITGFGIDYSADTGESGKITGLEGAVRNRFGGFIPVPVMVLTGISVILSLWSVSIINRDYSNADIRRSISEIVSDANEGDAIVATPHFMIDVLDYYMVGPEVGAGTRRSTQWRNVPVPLYSDRDRRKQDRKNLIVVDLPGLGGDIGKYQWSNFTDNIRLVEFRQSILGREIFSRRSSHEVEQVLDRELEPVEIRRYGGVFVKHYRIPGGSSEWTEGKVQVNCYPPRELAIFSPFFLGYPGESRVLNRGRFVFRILVPHDISRIRVEIVTLRLIDGKEFRDSVRVRVRRASGTYGEPIEFRTISRTDSDYGERFRSLDAIKVSGGFLELSVEMDGLTDGNGLRMLVFSAERGNP